MARQLSVLIQETIDRELPHLRALDDPASALRPDGDDSWSPKEELGHLLDSAANNHLRFVRMALHDESGGPVALEGYPQNDWVRLHGYYQMPLEAIVSLWYAYNAMLAKLVANIPENRLAAHCFIGSSAPVVTLGFVIEDYVVHMQHHIDHLLHRQSITEYPQPPKPRLAGTAVRP